MMEDLIKRSDVLALLAGDDMTGYKPSALRQMVEQLPNALGCKIGDPMYCVVLDDLLPKGRRHYILKEKVAEILITEENVLVGIGDGCYDKPGDVSLYGGVFLTAEEADALVDKFREVDA